MKYGQLRISGGFYFVHGGIHNGVSLATDGRMIKHSIAAQRL